MHLMATGAKMQPLWVWNWPRKTKKTRKTKKNKRNPKHQEQEEVSRAWGSEHGAMPAREGDAPWSSIRSFMLLGEIKAEVFWCPSLRKEKRRRKKAAHVLL